MRREAERLSSFRVELRRVVDDSYDIEIGADLAEKLVRDLKDGLAGKASRFAVVTDDTVKELYAGRILSLLGENGFRAELISFPPGEKSKTRQTKEKVEDAMLEMGFRRDCCVIAVGGGVVTDLAGFVAGTFGRGVPFINYATTLLAAADASVGGKTAVDTPLATNLIGLFNQPEKVYLDTAAWKTLPKEQLSSGLAETIKHAVMADRDFFDFLERRMEAIFALEEEACRHIAETNCRIKYRVVMQDERESGLREILNLGHTVGRAVETVSGYRLLHGQAVAVGLTAEALLASRLGYCTEAEAERVRSLLRRAGLPDRLPAYIDREALVRKLYTDKKVRAGQLRFVFQKGIGDMMCFGENVYSRPVEEALVREILPEM